MSARSSIVPMVHARRSRAAGTLGIGTGLSFLAVHGLHLLVVATGSTGVAAAFQFVCHLH